MNNNLIIVCPLCKYTCNQVNWNSYDNFECKKHNFLVNIDKETNKPAMIIINYNNYQLQIRYGLGKLYLMNSTIIKYERKTLLHIEESFELNSADYLESAKKLIDKLLNLKLLF